MKSSKLSPSKLLPPKLLPSKKCPALFIAATASGEGKTTVTAGIARYYSNQGKRVRVFKIGPDYLDPMILEKASENSVYPLDLWMVGEKECKNLLYEAASESDLMLIEGAMGLFDGTPSGADLAELFGIPVIVTINARSMAQTFAAVALGMTNFNPRLNMAGVLAVRTRSEWHDHVIRTQLSDKINFLGSVHEDQEAALPSRHLGLIQANEIKRLDWRLDKAAEAISQTKLASLPEPCEFSHEPVEPPQLGDLSGCRIGVAKDDAFSFIYPANIKCLQAMGAEIQFFSPLNDKLLPEVHSLWLPGGYPELHLPQLHNNQTMLQSIKQHYDNGKKIYAECGGMLYLAQTFQDLTGNSTEMVGIIPGTGILKEKGGCQGMQSIVLPQGKIRGHAHHRSTLETTLSPINHGLRTRSDAPGEAIYQLNTLTASFLHAYFPSNPKATASLFA